MTSFGGDVRVGVGPDMEGCRDRLLTSPITTGGRPATAVRQADPRISSLMRGSIWRPAAGVPSSAARTESAYTSAMSGYGR